MRLLYVGLDSNGIIPHASIQRQVLGLVNIIAQKRESGPWKV